MSILGVFREVKDSVVSAGAESVISGFLKPYGEVLSLQIDSDQKTLAMTLSLKGERNPVFIRAHGYRVRCEDGCGYLFVERFETNREWVSVVAERFVSGRWYEIPLSAAVGLRCLC